MPFAVLAVLLATAPRAPAAEQSMTLAMTPNARASIRLTNPGMTWDGLGFMPVEVLIENHVSEARTWQIAFVCGAQGFYGPSGANGGMHSSFQFTVGADATLDTVVFVPGPGATSRNISVNLQGTVTGPGVEQTQFSGLNQNNVAKSYIAVSAATEAEARRFFSLAPAGMGRALTDLELGTIDPGRWPADWRTWSPYSVVMLGTDDFAALDAARRAALRDWVALGGQLVLVPPKSQASAAVEKTGLGRIITLSQPLTAINKLGDDAFAKAQSDYTTAQSDYTTALAAWNALYNRRGPSTPSTTWPPPLRPEPPPPPPPPPPGKLDNLPLADGTTVSLNLAESGQRTAEPWAGQLRLLTNLDLEDFRIEKHPLALVIGLLVFALLVGPVNFFVFAPPGRRHRLFVTVPALSLLASLGLGAGIVIGDGFGGQGARRALVVLLPAENKAAVFQEQVARTGVLLGGEFPLAADTATGEPPADTGGGPAGNIPRLARTATTASGDWFRSHQCQVQQFWRITPTRGRIELVGGGTGGAAPVVQSSLTTALQDFVYLDADGATWAVDHLPPGQRITLQPDPKPWHQHRIATALGPQTPLVKEDLDYAAVREMLAQGVPMTRDMQLILRRGPQGGPVRPAPPDDASATAQPPPDTRERGHFYAFGGAGDLAPLDTLASIRWTAESIIYTGRLEAGRMP